MLHEPLACLTYVITELNFSITSICRRKGSGERGALEFTPERYITNENWKREKGFGRCRWVALVFFWYQTFWQRTYRTDTVNCISLFTNSQLHSQQGRGRHRNVICNSYVLLYMPHSITVNCITAMKCMSTVYRLNRKYLNERNAFQYMPEIQ